MANMESGAGRTFESGLPRVHLLRRVHRTPGVSSRQGQHADVA
ncbi:hypothetical protein [Streptomyces phaeochromogenes]